MSKAEEYYEEHLAGRGLAPSHVVAVKKVIAKALKKGEKPGVAVRAFLKEKGVTLSDGEAKAKPKETASPKAKPSAEPTPVVKLDEAEVRNMDRKSLKAMAAQITAMGVEVKVLKADDDATLRRKVADALAALPSPEVLKTLESIDPAKVATVLEQNCLGIYVDLRAPACLGCSDNAECVKEYLKNLKGNFSIFDKIKKEIQVEEQVAEVPAAVVEAQTKATAKVVSGKTGKVKKVGYDPKRIVFVQSIDNPLRKKDEGHATYQAILDELSIEAEDGKIVGPTMEQLRAIIEREYEVENDDQFIDWVSALRDDKVIKLDSDLSDEDKQDLRDAGVEI